MKDLVVLAADSHIEQTLLGLVPRHAALEIRPVSFGHTDIKVHPAKDGGCRAEGHAFLRSFLRQYRHGLVIFDHEGCGDETSPHELETQLDDLLARNGWEGNRARVIVIEPELEAWAWGRSSAIDPILGWAGRTPSLRTWLIEQGWSESETAKPARPKEAFQAALRVARKSPSASLFRKLAAEVSFRGCQDRAFNRLRAVLREWFPPTPEG